MIELWDVLDTDGNKTGRLHQRGKPMQDGDCHLVVQVWITNSKGELLISKRSNNVTGWANLWQTTGGAAVCGLDSLQNALKETGEEIGILLNPDCGTIFKNYKTPHTNDGGTTIFDVWLFRQEFDIADVVLAPEETCDAMWASVDMIKQMINNGTFIPPSEAYPYIDELFTFISQLLFY